MDTPRKPFRFRYVNEIAGLFVLAAVVLLAAAVLLAGRAQHWFERSSEIRIMFPKEGTFGLQTGSNVELLGTSIGRVEQIYVDEVGALHALLRVRGQFQRFIRVDSVAVVKKQFGVAGDSFIEITAGVRDPLPSEGATLPVRKDTEILELVQDIVLQLQQAVVPLLEEVQRTLVEYRDVAVELQDPEGDLKRTLAAARSIVEGVERGEGSVGRVLRDPTLARELEGILARARAITAQLEESLKKTDAILDDVRRSTAALPETAEILRGELRDVPGVVLQTQATLREAEQLLAGLQEHWFLRQYMNRPPPIETLPPPAGEGAP